MLLATMTWPEVEAYLERSSGIIMPIGSTEQHGPNGLIGTDFICASHIAERVGEASGIAVAPVQVIGMAEHHMAFAGTMTLRPSTLIAVIQDCVLSLAEHGFRQFFFINGHGGNIPTLNAAFYEVHNEFRRQQGVGSPGVSFKLANWWDNDGVSKISKETFGDSEGRHATASEVALTQYVDRATAKSVKMEPRIAPIGDGNYQGPGDFRRNFPDGRIGSDPSLANPEVGECLSKAAVEAIIPELQAFLAS